MSGTLAPLESALIPASPTQIKGSDVFVRALENEGVQYVFGVPGEENLDLLESLRTSTIRLVVTRHEQAAGFMAAMDGRLTDAADYGPEADPPEPPGSIPDYRHSGDDAASHQVRAPGSRCPQYPNS